MESEFHGNMHIHVLCPRCLNNFYEIPCNGLRGVALTKHPPPQKKRTNGLTEVLMQYIITLQLRCLGYKYIKYLHFQLSLYVSLYV